MRVGSLKEGDRFYDEDDHPCFGGSTYTIVTLNVSFPDVVHALIDESVVVKAFGIDYQVIKEAE